MTQQKTQPSQSITISLLQAREAVLVFFRPLFNKHGITEQQWRIIRLLAEHQSQKMDFHDLACKACILRPSLTGILNRLEKMKYVTRRKPATDQRKVILNLTEDGKKLYKTIVGEVDAGYEQIAKIYGVEKLANLQEMLLELKKVSDKYHEEHNEQE